MCFRCNIHGSFWIHFYWLFFFVISTNRRTRHIKEDEAGYLPDNVTSSSPIANLTNPTHDQENATSSSPETHEYDYVGVDSDVAPREVAPKSNSVDLTAPQYASVNKHAKSQNGEISGNTHDVPQPAEYETVLSHDNNRIYDAEYGAVTFTENDLYHR